MCIYKIMSTICFISGFHHVTSGSSLFFFFTQTCSLNLRVGREGSTDLTVGVAIERFQVPVGSGSVAEIISGIIDASCEAFWNSFT